MVAPALKYESIWTEKYIFVNHLSRPFIWESLRNFIFSRPNDDSWKLERTALKYLGAEKKDSIVCDCGDKLYGKIKTSISVLGIVGVIEVLVKS